MRLVEAAASVQGLHQRLVRENDPDELEKVLTRIREAETALAARIHEAGAGETGVRAAPGRLAAANRKVTEILLHGDFAQAQQTLIEESNPASDALIEAIGGFSARAQERARAEAERSYRGAKNAAWWSLAAALALIAAVLEWKKLRRKPRPHLRLCRRAPPSKPPQSSKRPPPVRRSTP